MMDLSRKKVVVTGGAGFLGRAVCAKLRERGCREVHVPRRQQYDLTKEEAVRKMYRDFSPQVVIHLAAVVGGIGANRSHPGRFFYDNLAMGLHLIEQGRQNRIEKFVQVGTVCAYPKFAPVPFREEDLWMGYPEETNAPYGVAKKSLFVMLDAYRLEYGLRSGIAVPVNLYGPEDNFDLASGHVLPALVRKCVEARDADKPFITCWGTGNASREFLYVDDAAEGVIRVAELMDDPIPINLGTGQEVQIRQVAELVAELTGFRGDLRWDLSQPDGQPRRCLNTAAADKLLGWKSTTQLRAGLERTIRWYEAFRQRQAA